MSCIQAGYQAGACLWTSLKAGGSCGEETWHQRGSHHIGAFDKDGGLWPRSCPHRGMEIALENKTISHHLRGCSHITPAKTRCYWTPPPPSVSNGQHLAYPPSSAFVSICPMTLLYYNFLRRLVFIIKWRIFIY